MFQSDDPEYLRELAAKMYRGFYAINANWVSDLADRVERTLAHIDALEKENAELKLEAARKDVEHIVAAERAGETIPAEIMEMRLR